MFDTLMIGGFGAGCMRYQDGSVRKGAHDVGGAAVDGHGVRSDEAANQIKLISSDEEVNS